MPDKGPQPLAYPIEDACTVGGFRRTTAYELMAEGKLDGRKIRGKTVITAESLRAYVAGLPAANIRTGLNRRSSRSAA